MKRLFEVEKMTDILRMTVSNMLAQVERITGLVNLMEMGLAFLSHSCVLYLTVALLLDVVFLCSPKT